MSSSVYHGKRIALVMDVAGREIVLRGTTSVGWAARHGQLLRVAIIDDEGEATGSPVFMISERRWRDHIASGTAYGCDLMLDLSGSAVATRHTA